MSKKDYMAEYSNDDKKISYYQVLNVSPNASLSDIKKQFRQCAIDFHPDNKKTGDTTLFALVARAYECLSDADKRTEYDKMLLLEKKTRKSNYLEQKKAFEDFIKAQDQDNEKKSKNSINIKHNYELDFIDLDNKQKFDRTKYEEEKRKPLVLKDTVRKLDDLIAAREQDEIEASQRKVFTDDKWNPEKFNQLFEAKYRKSKSELIKHTDTPAAFNVNNKKSPFDADDLFDENNSDCDMFASIDILNDGDNTEITDSDIKKLDKTNNTKYKTHFENRGGDYMKDIENKLKEREQESIFYNSRKVKDFDIDTKMGGYGFLHEVGITGKEIEWDDEGEIDKNTVQKLIEFRKLKL